jgi:hypothetical protein
MDPFAWSVLSFFGSKKKGQKCDTWTLGKIFRQLKKAYSVYLLQVLTLYYSRDANKQTHKESYMITEWKRIKIEVIQGNKSTNHKILHTCIPFTEWKLSMHLLSHSHTTWHNLLWQKRMKHVTAKTGLGIKWQELVKYKYAADHQYWQLFSIKWDLRWAINSKCQRKQHDLFKYTYRGK